jgi:hypothetical protein
MVTNAQVFVYCSCGRPLEERISNIHLNMLTSACEVVGLVIMYLGLHGNTRASEYKALRKMSGTRTGRVTGGLANFNNEELLNSYSSPNWPISVVISRTIRWTGCAPRIGKGKCEGKVVPVLQLSTTP